MDTTTDEESGNNSSPSTSPSKTYKCQLCSLQLLSMGQLKTHLNKNHKGSDNCYPCTECTSIFKRRDHLGRHMMTQHQINSQRIPCPFKDCDTVMTRKDHLRRHISQVHKVDPSEYLPSIKRRPSTTSTSQTNSLNESTSSTSSMPTNPSTSEGGDHTTKFKCVVTGCDAELSRKDHLCRHIKNVHKADPRDVIGHLYKTPRPEGPSPSKSPGKSSRKRRGDLESGGGGSRKKRGDIPIPSSSSSGGGGGGGLDLHQAPHPGHQAGHPSTLSDYDYGAAYDLDDFEDQQNEEHLMQDLEEEEEGEALCIFCCYSFYPRGEEEHDKLESFEFNRFFSEVLGFPRGDEGERGGGGLRFGDFLEFFGGSDCIFSVCGDCWGMLRRAMGRRLEVEEMEVGGRRGREMDRLRRSLGGYMEEMERIEGVVNGADLGGIEKVLKKGGRRGIKRQIYKAMVLRDTILEMTNELGKWRENVENRLIDKENLQVAPSIQKKDKQTDKVPSDQLPTQQLSSSSSSESEEDDDDHDNLEEIPRPPPPPEEPDYGSQRFECPFEDCYIKTVNKPGLLVHVNGVHSHEPLSIRKEIERLLKEQGLLPLKKGEPNPNLLPKYKQTPVPIQLLPSEEVVEFEGVNIAPWSCFRRTILLDCKKRKLRCAALQSQYSPEDIRDPRLECPLKYSPHINLFTVGDIPIIVDEVREILGCSKCTFWTSSSEPPPPNPRRPYSTKKISTKSKEIECHIQLAHLIIYQCPHCPNKLGSFRKFVLHLNEHPNRLSCNYCHKPYFRRNDLKRHRWTRHLTQEEIRGALERGEKDPRVIRRDNDLWRCAICGNSYENEVALRLHGEEIHSEEGRRGSWICEDCGMEYSTKGRLVFHRIMKCEERRGDGGLGEDGRWECEICGVSLKSWRGLGEHLKGVHSREAVEREGGDCEICGKGFKGRQGLEVHMRGHSRERAFGCRKECGARFKRRGHMEKHEKRCSGVFRGRSGPRKGMELVEGVRGKGYSRFDKVY